MIIDACSLPASAEIKTDICIVGAGIAGITLAREFCNGPFNVCLLESGGEQPSGSSQSLFWGENIGLPYYPLDMARTACLGGSSCRWMVSLKDERLGVRLRPLDEIDFEEREWVPYSGWPFPKSHLDTYYERAQTVCQIGPYAYDVSEWNNLTATPRLPFVNGRVQTVMFQFGARDLFMKEYPAEISRSGNVTALLHANASEVEASQQAGSIMRIRAITPERKQFWVSARAFILAAGAIEVPRLLLMSNRVRREGLGNDHDLVGRFFMEHPHLWSGLYVPSLSDIRRATALYRIHKMRGINVMGKISLSEDVKRSERLLGHCLSLHESVIPAKATRAPSFPVVSWPVLATGRSEYVQGARAGAAQGQTLSHSLASVPRATYRSVRSQCGSIYRKLMGSRPRIVFQLNHMSEQAPNPASRIVLSEERDALGRQRVNLDWRLSTLDIRTIVRSQEILDEELRKAGLGRLEISMRDNTPPAGIHGGWHHMGTTRMHRDPRKGVVDENSRVHGISNLFIAGPSVFPTSGYANPVLTIVALSLRLADHVRSLALVR